MKPFGIIPPTSTILFFSLFIFIFTSGVDGGSRAPLSKSTTITHQAHSFDDLAQWRQLIAKGTDFIKVDIRYALPSLCESQARVFNNDSRGCYLLTHDAPLSSETYYTAYDITAFVFDPENKHLFANGTHLYIYLDFKNNRDRYPTANLTLSDSLQKEYITFFTRELRKRNITNIELVYNGIYLDEYLKAYPWPRNYQFTAEDMKNNNSCLYTNKGQCRNTTIINNMANPLPFVDPGLSIFRMCEIDYGKFIDSKYPMVYYEPTDQRTIWILLDTYLQCGIEHKPGMAVSINIDPVQYDVYAGTRSGKTWNERIFKDAKWAHPVHISSNNRTVEFVTFYLTKENRIVYSFLQGAINVAEKNSTFPFGNLQVVTEPLPIQAGRFPFSASPFQKLRTFSFSAGGNQFIYVSDFRGISGIYSVEGLSLKSIANFTLSHGQSESLALIEAGILHMTINNKNDDVSKDDVADKDDMAAYSQNGWVQVEFLQTYVTYKKGIECTLMIQWWRLRFNPKGSSIYELFPVGEPTCGVYSPSHMPVPVDSASISLSPLSLSEAAKYCVDSTHVGLLVVSSHKNIYGGVVCANSKQSEVRVCTDDQCSLSQNSLSSLSASHLPSPSASPSLSSPPSSNSPSLSFSAPPPSLADLDVGTFPSLSFSTLSSGEVVVLEVHGDGFCYNSDWNNKKAKPSVCALKAISSRYVLNYNYGTLKEWIAHIFTPKSGKVTSCSGGIFHGTFDEGSLPSAFLFRDARSKMRMVSALAGFPTGAVDYAGCSWPVSYDGALIDGVVLPDVLKMKGGKWNPSDSLMQYVTPKSEPNYKRPVYTPKGEVSISTTICDMCRERLFKWQVKYQSDYELMYSLSLKVADMCAVGQLLIGDGTVVGCKNLVLLYLPALAVDVTRNVFSPENCMLAGLCSGNASSFLPDINSQVARNLPYTVADTQKITNYYNKNIINNNNNKEDEKEEPQEMTADQMKEREREREESPVEIMKLIRNAVKTQLLKSIGL